MLKCSPEAFACCPTSQYCGNSAAECDFLEGSDCDKFNQRVYASGQFLCLPREDSFLHKKQPIEEAHPDWRLTACPICGAGCYTSPSHERMLAWFPGLKAACTQCVLRIGRCNR